MNRWRDAYPELVNKLRWAISTAFATPDDRYPYSIAQRIATIYAQEILDLVKFGEECPEILGSTGTIRSYLQQVKVQAELDKLS